MKCLNCLEKASFSDRDNLSKIFCSKSCQKAHYDNVAGTISLYYNEKSNKTAQSYDKFLFWNDLKTLPILDIASELEAVLVPTAKEPRATRRVQIKKWLLAFHESSPRARDRFFKQLLQACMPQPEKKTYPHLMEFLISKAKIDLSAREFDDIISIAIDARNVSLLRALVRVYSTSFTYENDNRLRKLLQDEQTDILFILIQSTILTNDTRNALLADAIRYANAYIVDILLKYPIEIVLGIPFSSILDTNPASVPSILRLLAERELLSGVDLSFLFQTAVRNNYPQIVTAILDNFPNFDPSQDENRALQMAAATGNAQIVNLLLQRGVAQKPGTDLAVYWAKLNGHHSINLPM